MRKSLLFMFCLMSLTACMPKNETHNCIFSVGDMARSVVSGSVGQILSRMKWEGNHCVYMVRFAAIQKSTDTHLLSPDGPITDSMFTVRLKEFELKEIQ